MEKNIRKRRILIVDDDISLGQVLKLGLERQGGCEVKFESSAHRCLATARTFKPDIFLLDVMMPDLPGGEVAAAIRADPRFKQTPIVFLTSLASKDDGDSGRIVSGGFRFLPKPVTPEQVLACIQEELPAAG